VLRGAEGAQVNGVSIRADGADIRAGVGDNPDEVHPTLDVVVRLPHSGIFPIAAHPSGQ